MLRKKSEPGVECRIGLFELRGVQIGGSAALAFGKASKLGFNPRTDKTVSRKAPVPTAVGLHWICELPECANVESTTYRIFTERREVRKGRKEEQGLSLRASSRLGVSCFGFSHLVSAWATGLRPRRGLTSSPSF